VGGKKNKKKNKNKRLVGVASGGLWLTPSKTSRCSLHANTPTPHSRSLHLSFFTPLFSRCSPPSPPPLEKFKNHTPSYPPPSHAQAHRRGRRRRLGWAPPTACLLGEEAPCSASGARSWRRLLLLGSARLPDRAPPRPPAPSCW
jgi:hypothetical protein